MTRARDLGLDLGRAPPALRHSARATLFASRRSTHLPEVLISHHRPTVAGHHTESPDSSHMQLIGRAFVAGGAALCMLTHQPAAVADTGAVIFETKCAACHANGGNVLNPQKTLDAKALEKFKYNEQAAVVQLLKNGKGQMPKYQGAIPPISRLSDEDIEAVAQYVLDTSARGW